MDADVTTTQRGPEERPLGDIVQEISEHASVLVREEIELAKAEVQEKAARLARGAAAGAAAGVFVVFALIYLLEAAAWALDDTFGWGGIWPGFLIVGGALVLLGALAGLLALRFFKAGAPPTPDQAIEEARLIREALEHPEVQAGMAQTERAAAERHGDA